MVSREVPHGETPHVLADVITAAGAVTRRLFFGIESTNEDPPSFQQTLMPHQSSVVRCTRREDAYFCKIKSEEPYNVR